MIMQNAETSCESPKFMLGKMFQDLCNLSAKIHALDINNKTEKELSNLIRKVYVSWTSYDKYLVAIAGLQGVGKTTFLRNYLGLDSTWLKETEGRGECFPVLVIQEPGRKEAEGIIRKLTLKDGLYTLQEQSVTPDEFPKTIRSGFGDGSDSTLTLLPVLKIPVATPFHQISFLLLPGYETKKADWQELMCHGLMSANLPVIVTDSQSLASDGIKDIRDDLKKFLENVEPDVIYSKIDEGMKTPEKAFERVQAVLGIRAEKHLVFAGSGHLKYVQSWRDNVNQAIEDSYIEQSLWRKKQLSFLKTLISEEMRLLLADMNGEIASITIYDKTDSLLAKIQKEYDKARTSLRKEFYKEVDTIIAKRGEAAKEEAITRYNKEEGGNIIETAGQKIRDWFCEDDRKARNLNKILKESWEKTDNDFSELYLNYITNLTYTRLEICNARTNDSDSGQPQASILKWGRYSDEGESSTNASCAIKDEILTNIRLIFHDLDTVATSKQDEYYLTTIKLLPVLALELSRLYTLNSYFAPKPDDKVPKSETSFLEAFSSNTESGKKILQAIGYMLFIDMSADAKIDTIPAFWKLITGNAAMNSFGSAAAAVFLIGTMGITLGNEINKEHGHCRESLCQGIEDLKTSLKTDIMNAYDDTMDKLYETIENRFREKHHLDAKLGYSSSAKQLVSRLKHDSTIFLTNIDLFLQTDPVS